MNNIKEIITITLTQEEHEDLMTIVKRRDNSAAEFICGYLLGKAERQYLVSKDTHAQ